MRLVRDTITPEPAMASTVAHVVVGLWACVEYRVSRCRHILSLAFGEAVFLEWNGVSVQQRVTLRVPRATGTCANLSPVFWS